MENRRTVGIIATIATVLLCGCPGLIACIFGAVTVFGGLPWTTTINGVENTGTLPSGWGFAMLCGALILILIPILVGFFTLRNKPVPQVPGPIPYRGPDEPLPPPS